MNEFDNIYYDLKDKQFSTYNNSLIPNHEIKFWNSSRNITLRKVKDEYFLTIYNHNTKKFIIKERKFKTISGIKKSLLKNYW